MESYVRSKKIIATRLIAAIDIGASAVRMQLAEVMPNGKWNAVENVSQAIQLGKDAFNQGRILPETAFALVSVLRQFKKLISEYAPPETISVRAVATSALREAENRDAVMDRIFVATGFEVILASDVDINRMTYMGLAPILRQHAVLRKGELLAAEIGGGLTEFLGFDSGNIKFAKSSRLGLIRLYEQLTDNHLPKNKSLAFLNDQIGASIEVLKGMQFKTKTPKLLFIGREARFAARELDPEWKETGLAVVDVRAIEKLAAKLIADGPESVAAEYRLLYHEAETLGIALLGYVQLAQWHRVRQVYISSCSLRDGIIAEIIGGAHWTEEFCRQVRTSAIDIGEKYFWGKRHAMTVAGYATSIFDALASEHGLSSHYRLILEIAAMLHDIGSFISPKEHHLHSMYLIQYSDLFGLGEEYIRLIALIARYHRKSLPIQSDSEFSGLSSVNRVILLKLAGMLRVADALDRSHSVRLGNILKFRITETTFEIIPLKPLSESAVETFSLKAKGNLFEDVFGLAPVVCQQ